MPYCSGCKIDGTWNLEKNKFWPNTLWILSISPTQFEFYCQKCKDNGTYLNRLSKLSGLTQQLANINKEKIALVKVYSLLVSEDLFNKAQQFNNFLVNCENNSSYPQQQIGKFKVHIKQKIDSEALKLLLQESSKMITKLNQLIVNNNENQEKTTQIKNNWQKILTEEKRAEGNITLFTDQIAKNILKNIQDQINLFTTVKEGLQKLKLQGEKFTAYSNHQEKKLDRIKGCQSEIKLAQQIQMCD